jgi:hypothetical protein
MCVYAAVVHSRHSSPLSYEWLRSERYLRRGCRGSAEGAEGTEGVWRARLHDSETLFQHELTLWTYAHDHGMATPTPPLTVLEEPTLIEL